MLQLTLMLAEVLVCLKEKKRDLMVVYSKNHRVTKLNIKSGYQGKLSGKAWVAFSICLPTSSEDSVFTGRQ